MCQTKKVTQNLSEGQSVAEIAVAAPFLIVLVLAVIEMGLVFASFISVVTAAHDAALFASDHPTLSESSHDSDLMSAGSISQTVYSVYTERATQDILEVNQDLKTSLTLTPDALTVARPIVEGTATCPTQGHLTCLITVTITYQLHTMLSGVSLPYFDRFGLPSYYTIQYSVAMPIKSAFYD